LNSIISILVLYNQFLLTQIRQLLLFIARNIPLKQKYDTTSPKYNKFTVDRLPVIKQFKKLDYKQLLIDYKAKHGKKLRPIKPRSARNTVSSDIVCPRCCAPHSYLYDNTGGRGQLWCKVCDFKFNKQKKDFMATAFVCPYCGKNL